MPHKTLLLMVEYDMDSQIIKIESVFHHEYTAAATATASNRSRSRSRSRSKPSKDRSQDGKALKQGTAGRQSHRSSRPGASSGIGVGPGPRGQRLHRKANNDNKNSTTIDLTLDDDEDEDAVMGEVDHYDSQEEDTSSPNSTYTNHRDPATFKKSCVDLTTSTDDEQDQDSIPTTHSSAPDNALEKTATTTTKLRRTPKVVLWVDTQLLGERAFEANALLQFMGEVMYCHPVAADGDGDGTEPVRRSVRGGGGHWVLQARTARLMDGLDLYSYRQAILLTRDLVQQYRERDKELELEKKDEKKQKERKEEEQEKEGQEGSALVVELE
ncbi:hypothetical protein BGZ95_010606 [Linnemannia exigua]|uniref:Uncharacterized protein n=1 Tax=Linnemannia exigua TaxID=604196 RepID=A0AAD4H684_9FUNG|nr:hypothetical protein BGZ95_010606 [Linnemannia exigua]